MRHERSERVRHVWVDVAKGVTMLLVVLSHVIYKHYVPLDWSAELPIRGGWIAVNELFAPVRMPLFLLLSGYLAASSLDRDRRTSLARRTVNPYALYLLWFAINAAFLAVFDFARQEGLELTARGLAQNVLFPHTTLWYMVALVVAYAAAMLLRPAGGWGVGAAALVSASVFSGWLVLPEWTGMWESILRYAFLFLIGALLPGRVTRLAGVRRPSVLILAIAGWLLVAVGLQAGADGLALFGPAAVAFGAATGLLIAVRLTDLARTRRVLSSVGRRTLPIFVLHIPVLAVVHWLATGPGAPLWGPLLTSSSVALAYPVLLTFLVTAVALRVHRVLLLAGAGWLFSLPIGRDRSPAAPSAGRPATRP